MKKLVFVIAAFFLMSCNGQNKDLNNPTMITAHFDIEKFNKDRTTIFEGEKILSSSVTDTIDGKIRIRTVFDGGFIESWENENSFFVKKIEYYQDGSVKKQWSKHLVDYITGFAPWGNFLHYDDKGKLIAEKNYEQLYQNLKVNPERLFEILDKESIYKGKNGERYRLTVWFHDKSTKSEEMIWNKIKYSNGENPFWEVVMDFRRHEEESINEKIYKIDAVTEKISRIK